MPSVGSVVAPERFHSLTWGPLYHSQQFPVSFCIAIPNMLYLALYRLTHKGLCDTAWVTGWGIGRWHNLLVGSSETA